MADYPIRVIQKQSDFDMMRQISPNAKLPEEQDTDLIDLMRIRNLTYGYTSNSKTITVGTTPTALWVNERKSFISLYNPQGVAPNKYAEILPSAARVASGNSQATPVYFGSYEEIGLGLIISAVGGTLPLLSMNLYTYDELSGQWILIEDNIFFNISSTGNYFRKVPLSGYKFAVSWVITGTLPTFTFSLVAIPRNGLLTGSGQTVFTSGTDKLVREASAVYIGNQAVNIYSGIPLNPNQRLELHVPNNLTIYGIATEPTPIVVFEQ